MRSRKIALVLYIVAITVYLVIFKMLVHDVDDKARDLASKYVKSNYAGIKSTIYNYYQTANSIVNSTSQISNELRLQVRQRSRTKLGLEY